MKQKIILIKFIPILLLVFSYLSSINGCKKNELVASDEPCLEGHVAFAKLTIESDTLGRDTIRCPIIIFGQRPYHFGDTLTVNVNQPFDFSGVPVIGNKPVYVTITSKFGDRETYLLKSGLWPCETVVGEDEIFHAVIFYTYSLSLPSIPTPENGLLEINSIGDTLIVSYRSYCSGNTLRDTVAILPK